MTELAAYLGMPVHLDTTDGVCGDGQLWLDGRMLRFTGDPHWRYPLAWLRARVAPFGPVELAHQGDVVLLGRGDFMAQIWRDRERQPWCDPAWWPTSDATPAAP